MLFTANSLGKANEAMIPYTMAFGRKNSVEEQFLRTS